MMFKSICHWFLFNRIQTCRHIKRGPPHHHPSPHRLHHRPPHLSGPGQRHLARYVLSPCHLLPAGRPLPHHRSTSGCTPHRSPFTRCPRCPLTRRPHRRARRAPCHPPPRAFRPHRLHRDDTSACPPYNSSFKSPPIEQLELVSRRRVNPNYWVKPALVFKS